MRRRIMAGNWKMYKTAPQTARFFEKLAPLVSDVVDADIVIFPTALCVSEAVAAAKSHPLAHGVLQVGGQNIYWGKEGAFTGEISATLLHETGATWTLVGHSERRQFFHETDADVLKKTQAAIEAGLSPIVCVGERLEEHSADKTTEVLVRQFAAGVAGLTEEFFAKIAIAYEPVWAIGTGKTATPQIASAAHRLIRTEAERRFGSEAAQQLRILYGGSVKPENTAGLLAETDIDGVLVGGASLDPETFAKIVHVA